MSIQGLSHVVIRVRDMDESIDFYTKHFGWTKIFDDLFEGPDFSRSVGQDNARVRAVGGTISYLRVEFVETSWTPKEPAGEGVGLGCLTFQASDIQAVYDKMIADDVTVSGEPQEVQGTKLYFAWDPNGQKIEIVEYSDQGDAWGGPGQGSHPLLK